MDLLKTPSLVACSVLSSETADSLDDLRQAIERATPDERHTFAPRLGEALGSDPHGDGIRAALVRQIVEARMSIGFHTLGHDTLPQLPDDQLERAMVAGKTELEAVVGSALTLIAYPHGKADARVAESARKAGFRIRFIVGGSTVTAEDNTLLVPRLSPPPGTSPGHFASRLVYQLLRRPSRAA